MGPRNPAFTRGFVNSNGEVFRWVDALTAQPATRGPDWTKIETYWPHLAANKGK